MTWPLYLAALLAGLLGLAHSVLGERYILIRLFRRQDLPKLFGSQDFTVRTLRFAWHLTTLAWWGFAALMLTLAQPDWTRPQLLLVVAATFAASSLLTVAFSRGRHLAWPVMAAIALLVFHSI
ncbi:hypothetical protein [Chitinolyticbacter albus]|uniref:hypothetical protein n=1 Tax=Chitinolyticbacter albus TaxID=2961951 RepID=UPI00210DCF44|nr:hypothetical protein [Chitinolyticbacter albus]